MDFKPLSPQELRDEFQKLNEAKEADRSNQLDRVEKKLDDLSDRVEFLISIQPK